MAYGKSSTAMLIILIVIGSIFGSLLGEIFGNFFPLLNSSYTMGFAPFTLDLMAISFTFGLQIKVSIFTILGFFLGLFLYKRI